MGGVHSALHVDDEFMLLNIVFCFDRGIAFH